MASNGTELFPGQSAPVTVITSTDQSGILLIATILAMIFALVSLIIRLFVRLEFHHEFASDDIVAFLAMIFSVFQSAAVFVQVSKGFGKTITNISDAHLVQLQKAAYSSELLYIITLWLSKCSVAFLFIRLSPNKRHNLMSNLILLASTLFMVISIFVIAIRCDINHPWTFIDEQCKNLLARWEVVAVFDILTEIALFSTSIYLVQGLQLSLAKKSVVILAFGLRLPVIVPTIVRLHYLNVEFSSSNPTLHGVLAAVCTQIELSYAIIAATVPCLRPFMTALSTNYGAPAQAKASPSGTGRGGAGNEYSLNSVSKMSSLAGKAKQITLVPATRWDHTEHHASVMSGDQHSMESHESKQMIIAKNTVWAVEYEGQSGLHSPRREGPEV